MDRALGSPSAVRARPEARPPAQPAQKTHTIPANESSRHAVIPDVDSRGRRKFRLDQGMMKRRETMAERSPTAAVYSTSCIHIAKRAPSETLGAIQ